MFAKRHFILSTSFALSTEQLNRSHVTRPIIPHNLKLEFQSEEFRKEEMISCHCVNELHNFQVEPWP